MKTDFKFLAAGGKIRAAAAYRPMLGEPAPVGLLLGGHAAQRETDADARAPALFACLSSAPAAAAAGMIAAIAPRYSSTGWLARRGEEFDKAIEPHQVPQTRRHTSQQVSAHPRARSSR